MNPIMPSMAALAVSTIFCVWNNYRQVEHRRRQQLRERVAYLLWAVATRPG